MKVDIGFWDSQGNYIPDIQEIGVEEMDKNFNEFFDELNDMANFKGFREKKETECEYCEDCSFCKGCFKLQQENAELKAENERLKQQLKNQQHINLKQQDIALSYWDCLQEIKGIAEENKDTVQYGGICRSILMEITKAEEE